MRTPELERRHTASALLSKMLLLVVRLMDIGHRRNRNLAAHLAEMMVIMTIRVNDERGKPPLSENKLSKMTGLSRETVGRWLVPLTRHRVVKKVGKWGHVGDDAYLEKRIDALYFRRIAHIIIVTGRMLERLGYK